MDVTDNTGNAAAEGPRALRAPLAVETVGLRKAYGRRIAVANLSLQVPAGEVFGFLGPNGAGKSTTVKMLVGLVHPSSGEGRLFGRPLGDTAARRWLGFLPEHFRFHEWLRAEEFLDLHASLYGVPKRQRPARIAEALKLVGLESRAHDVLRTFSKGMLQRIGIGQALIADPKLVILDEPTSALDPIGRRDVRDLIRTLRARGVAVFLNSHLLSEVEMVCDRVAIIDRGQVVRQGRIEELLRGTLELEVRVAGASERVLAEIERRWPRVTRTGGPTTPSRDPERTDIRTLHYVVQDEREVAEIADLIVKDGARLLALVPRQATLEELFIESVESREV